MYRNDSENCQTCEFYGLDNLPDGEASPCDNCDSCSNWMGKIMTLDITTVNVRWFDGYLETFEAVEVRFGCDLLWMRLSDGKNRHIPLRNVRWFGLSKESHAVE
jgi:hypothetical protein